MWAMPRIENFAYLIKKKIVGNLCNWVQILKFDFNANKSEVPIR